MRQDYIQPDVGHYGVFNGRRFRTEIYPRMREFMRTFQSDRPRDGARKPAAAGSRVAQRLRRAQR